LAFYRYSDAGFKNHYTQHLSGGVICGVRDKDESQAGMPENGSLRRALWR
jgi:hypothetical protein